MTVTRASGSFAAIALAAVALSGAALAGVALAVGAAWSPASAAGRQWSTTEHVAGRLWSSPEYVAGRQSARPVHAGGPQSVARPARAGAVVDESRVFLPLVGTRIADLPPEPSQTWAESNDGLTSWSVVGLQVDPFDRDTVYALTRSHGMYRSIDGGRSWFADNTGLPDHPNVSMGHTHGNLLTIDPNDGGVLYANFGGQAHKYRRDSGWMDINAGIDVCDGRAVVAMVVDPQDSSHIFAGLIASGCPGGIYESTDADADAGLTWSHIASWSGSGQLENDAWTLAIDPSDASRLFVAPPYLGFLYSTDGGRHWRRDTPLGEGRRGASVVAVHPVQTNRVVLGHGSGIHVGEYAASADGFDWSWSDLTDQVQGYVWDIDFAPSEPDTVMAATTAGLFRSEDGGESWHSVGDHAGRFVKSAAFDPTDPATVYLGSGNGVFRSTDGGWTVEDVTGEIPPEMEVQATAISDLDPSVYYCNLYGVAFCVSKHRGHEWRCPSNDPRVTRAIAIAVHTWAPGIVYTGMESVLRSEDWGETWQVVLDPGEGRQFFDIEADPAGVLWAGAVYTISAEERYAELYRSTDRGDTWTGPIEDFTHRSISVGPIVSLGDGVVYVASYDHVRRSEDGGVTWQRLTNGLSGHPDDKWVDGLAVDPEEPNRLYLVSRGHRLLGSVDGGESWQLLDAAAPQYPGRVIIDYSDHRVFYVFGLNGWRRYEDFGARSVDLPTAGIHASYNNFRRTALQDPLYPDRFVTGDLFQGFLEIVLGAR
ncbi:MAG: hypothetical protein ACK2T6_06550 [Anaerolineae bacterium]